MSDLDLTEAVVAAQRDDIPLSVIITAVTRAAPHIERQIRERIAAELDKQGDNPGRVETFADQIWWEAASIARGTPVPPPVVYDPSIGEQP